MFFSEKLLLCAFQSRRRFWWWTSHRPPRSQRPSWRIPSCCPRRMRRLQRRWCRASPSSSARSRSRRLSSATKSWAKWPSRRRRHPRWRAHLLRPSSGRVFSRNPRTGRRRRRPKNWRRPPATPRRRPSRRPQRMPRRRWRRPLPTPPQPPPRPFRERTALRSSWIPSITTWWWFNSCRRLRSLVDAAVSSPPTRRRLSPLINWPARKKQTNKFPHLLIQRFDSSCMFLVLIATLFCTFNCIVYVYRYMQILIYSTFLYKNFPIQLHAKMTSLKHS